MTADWELRFRAPKITLPDHSPHAPERLVYTGTESGIWQAHTWDVATGVRRKVTDHPVGVIDAFPTLDGEGVVWWQEEDGDESGRFFVQPFAGGETVPFLEGAPRGWHEGIAQAPGVVAAGISDDAGFAVWVALDGGPVRELVRSDESLRIGGTESVVGFNRAGLSADGSLLCLEHGDLIHPALRVVDPRTGEVVGGQADAGLALHAACWSPVGGDRRLVLHHEREDGRRPAVWDLATGERTDLTVDLEGVVEVQDWWPDASALLLVHRFEGSDAMLRYDIASGGLTPIEIDPGVVRGARVRPDGRIWYRHECAERAPRVLDDTGREVRRAEGDAAPAGRPFTSWHFDNGLGDRVHGFYVAPEGRGPFPVVMLVHGGPNWLDTDQWDPEAQAYVDAGFAVGMVNYRGSIGYGRAWEDVLIGNVGGPELEDVNAGLADLVARGVADPGRAVIAGWSWGGYVTLLELGKHPELWSCGVAGVPVGDYEASWEGLSPALKAYDRALLGGAPWEVPELMRDRNPIHFADEVRAPVLFLIGEHDSRCPYKQAMLYVDKLAAREHPHDLYVYATGHSSFDLEEEVRQQRLILEFLARHVPGVRVPV